MQAPRGRQFKTHGNVVNVPAEVSETVNNLCYQGYHQKQVQLR